MRYELFLNGPVELWPESLKFYEVHLSNCDGSDATIYLWNDGKIDLGINKRARVRKLARLCLYSEFDKDMPEWAKIMMRKLEKPPVKRS